ncbi:MAG: hypothetical protein AAF911_09155 [Planctomycetota bacterium]
MTDSQVSKRHAGFTAIDLIVVVAVVLIVSALVAVMLPMLGSRGGGSRMMMNNVQLRGIHQGFVTFAQSNKIGGSDGYFPGLDGSGQVVPDGPSTFYSGDGTHPAARLVMLLNGNYFTPEYMINPADIQAQEVEFMGPASEYERLDNSHFSYAMLGLAEALAKDDEGNFAAGDDTRAVEWRETLNTSAIVMSDRAIGTGRADLSSVWTDAGSGDWRGGVVHNDNSTMFETTAEFEQTKYGNALANAFDHIFEDAPAESDALMVFEDATTAYSAD